MRSLAVLGMTGAEKRKINWSIRWIPDGTTYGTKSWIGNISTSNWNYYNLPGMWSSEKSPLSLPASVIPNAVRNLAVRNLAVRNLKGTSKNFLSMLMSWEAMIICFLATLLLLVSTRLDPVGEEPCALPLNPLYRFPSNFINLIYLR